MTDDAFRKATIATYRIDGMGGEIARQLPSIAAAKECYRDIFDRSSPVSDLSFCVTMEDPDGWDRTLDPHLACVEHGRAEAWIWRERPRWPERLRLSDESTELAMMACTASRPCRHDRLICRSVGDAGGAFQPSIACADCDQTWSPAPLVDADPADCELLASASIDDRSEESSL